MATDIVVQNLVLNRLSKEQYESIETPNPNELYLVEDDDIIQSIQAVPDTTTVGSLGQLKAVTAAGRVGLYMLVSINRTDPDNPVYNWKKLAFAGGATADIDPTTNSMIVPDGTVGEDNEANFTDIESSIDPETHTLNI